MGVNPGFVLPVEGLEVSQKLRARVLSAVSGGLAA